MHRPYPSGPGKADPLVRCCPATAPISTHRMMQMCTVFLWPHLWVSDWTNNDLRHTASTAPPDAHPVTVPALERKRSCHALLPLVSTSLLVFVGSCQGWEKAMGVCFPLHTQPGWSSLLSQPHPMSVRTGNPCCPNPALSAPHHAPPRPWSIPRGLLSLETVISMFFCYILTFRLLYN